jgi:hypothetical protein
VRLHVHLSFEGRGTFSGETKRGSTAVETQRGVFRYIAGAKILMRGLDKVNDWTDIMYAIVEAD